MQGVFQHIGKDCAEHHFRAGKFLPDADLYLPSDPLLLKPRIIDGQYGIHHLIFTIGLDYRIIIGLADLIEIFQRFFTISLLDQSPQDGHMMSRIMPQD